MCARSATASSGRCALQDTVPDQDDRRLALEKFSTLPLEPSLAVLTPSVFRASIPLPLRMILPMEESVVAKDNPEEILLKLLGLTLLARGCVAV
jgi:hypothetical protein